MKTFSLKKLDDRSWCDYILSYGDDCVTSPRGNTRCKTSGHLFLMEEDLQSIKEVINEEISPTY